jgi:pyruvate dehydrogenase E2 component (dihydrolipoamide acetyltransferase)
VATQIIMPKLGMAMTEGAVVKWVKRDGETVNKGDPLVVVMSRKISYQVEAPATGIVRHIVQEKETRPVGAVIGYILAPGEAMPEVAPPPVAAPVAAAPEAPPIGAPAPAPAAPPSEAAPFVLASPAARRLAKELGIDLAQVRGSGPEGRITEADVQRAAEEHAKGAMPPAPAPAEVLASPMARTLAREHGIDLAQVKGTGAGGRITEKDVLAFIEARKAAPPVAAPPTRAIPFVGMRQMIAQRMSESLQSMAQVTLLTEADVTEMVRLREQLKQRYDLSYTDIIVKAVAVALKEHPLLNATLVGEEIQLLSEVHIGVAVALEDGLIVPVVRDADKKTLQEIAQETRRLAEGARAGTLTVDEVTGSTFTITNLGMYHVDGFTPIINPPEAAILGVGRIVEKPAIYQGEIAKRAMLTLSLTFDHRLVDGAPAAAFLDRVRELLETPALIFA